MEAAFTNWEAWDAATDGLDAAIDRFAVLSDIEVENPESLARILRAREEVYQRAAQVEGYVRLRLQLDGGDDEARAREARLDGIDRRWYGEASAWFSPRLRSIEPALLRTWLAETETLAPYRRFLERDLRSRVHNESDDDPAAWAVATAAVRQLQRASRTLDGVEAPTVTVSLESGTTEEITAARSKTILWELASAADRAAVQRAWLEALDRRSETNAVQLEGILDYRVALAKARGYSSALAMALAGDAIPVSAVTNLVDSTFAEVEPLRRYQGIRRAELGLEHYGSADRFLPLGPEPAGIPFTSARRWIIECLAPLGVEVQILVEQAFDEGWIDAVPRPGKRAHGGATAPIGSHPYVLVNYDGTLSTVLQLAHEIGHAVHLRLSYESRGYTDAPPSTLTSETVAFVFETLLVDRLMDASAVSGDPIGSVDAAIQSLLRASYRPVLDAAFELSLYDDRPTFSAAGLGARYLELMRAMYGESLDLEAWDGFGWLQTPHFYSSPHYMPRYGLAAAAAVRLVAGLKAVAPADAAAARLRFLALLAAGGSGDPFALLAAAGADLEDPATIAAVGERLQLLAGRLEGALAMTGTGSDAE